MLTTGATVALLAFLAIGALLLALAMAGARSSKNGDLAWRLARLERKIDLLLLHHKLTHDEQVPEPVLDLVRQGKTIEAIRAYRRATGASLAIAKREIEHLTRTAAPKGSDPPIENR